MDALTKVVTVRVAPETWANFERVAAANGVQPNDLLRDLVAHADSAYRAVRAGGISSMDGDVAGWVTKEFPRLPPDELRLFAAVLASAANKMEAASGVKG